MRVPFRMIRRPRRRLRLRRFSLRFDLRKALFILPNLFTVASIFCGFYAAVIASEAASKGRPEDLYTACFAVLLAMVFDSVDGRVARLTRTQSDFGVQMDSLADVMSFGVVPALVAWHWGLSNYGQLGLAACFVFTACGAIRLARFNVLAARSPLSRPLRAFWCRRSLPRSTPAPRRPMASRHGPRCCSSGWGS